MSLSALQNVARGFRFTALQLASIANVRKLNRHERRALNTLHRLHAKRNAKKSK